MPGNAVEVPVWKGARKVPGLLLKFTQASNF